MDRKKTILIAVLVNAGLLVLLFVVALHREDAPSKGADLVQVVPQENQPLFNDAPLISEAPLAQAVPGAVPADADALAGSQIAAASSSLTASGGEIVHQLPPLAPEEPDLIHSSSIPAPVAPSPISRAAEVKVKRGDSLERIAKAHRTTVDEIIRMNQLPSSFLRIGQVLKVPSEVARNRSSQQKALVSDLRMNDAHGEYYTVKVGDNPWTIALKHHMRVDELLKVNHLNEEKARRLKPGDRLRVR